MHKANINRLNLNLLKTLDAVLTEKSVSRAADKIFLSQPALSHALAQLREVLEDDILVRSKKGMELTEFAVHIAPEVKHIMHTIEELFTDTSGFDPINSDHTFNFALKNDVAGASFIPPLLQWIHENNSKLHLNVKHMFAKEALRQLESGEIDLFLSGQVPNQPRHILKKQVLTSKFACLVRQSHPLTAATMTLDNYLRYPHVVFSGHLLSQNISLIDGPLSKLGLQRDIKLTLDIYTSLGLVLESTNMIATMTEMQANIHAKQNDLKVLPCPKELPQAELKGYLYWHKRVDKQLALNWLIDFFDKFHTE